jgi:ribulose 1,5-bisphosphate synthetase/thiazole synthase
MAMSRDDVSRRTFLKQTSVATGMSAAGVSVACASDSIELQAAADRPLLAQTDVLVVGGGPAGFGAAVGAARHGATVLLIENYGFCGGVGAWGLGMQLNQMRPGAEARSVVHETLLEKLQAYGPLAVRVNDHQFLCNVEYLKAAILDVLDEAGCRYLVHCRAVDTLVQSGRVAGVVVATKSGLMRIEATVTIDCTGDADVTALAGAETFKETGRLSPQTLLMSLLHIPRRGADERSIDMDQARAKYPLIPPTWFAGRVSNCDFSFVNHAGTREMGNFDVTDVRQFSEAECKSRRQILQLVAAIREFGGPDLADVEICGASPQMGVRESRRVKGLYVLTEEDALTGAKFDDVVAWRSGYLDIGFVRFDQMKIHQVPYRALVPERVDGLLTAGRSISASHPAASAGKSMGNCVATGHAAGIAAALAVQQSIQPRDVSVATIQQRLREDGVDLTKGGEDQASDMPA